MQKSGKLLPLISIVIPSYNAGEYIEETLESIFSQDYDNFEVIVRDGGSTDGTVKIIREYAKKYPKRLSWVSEKDNGQLDAILKGLKKAKGEILTYINADDVYEKNALTSVVAAYKNNSKALWFVGRGKVINKEGVEISKLVTLYKNFLLTINNYQLLLTVNYLMQPSVFLTRKAYARYGPFTGTRAFIMEYDLWLKLGKVEMPVVIKKTLSSFRITGENISATAFDKTLSEDEKTVAKYTKNRFIIIFHKFHNMLRKAIIRVI